MGGCCGGMKTGQKSLPDKKKSSSDVAAQEKSNGKEAIPAADAAKTPTPDAAEGQQEPTAAPVKGAEPVVGSDNVMDLETAVAPYEGIVSNAADQPPQIQANVAAADSELLLPYQIPVQHTLSCTTTTTTVTAVGQEGVEEPQLDAHLQGGSALAALVSDLASSSGGDVQVKTVTKVTETVPTEAIPELGASGTVEFGGTGASGETAEEPVAVVVKSSFHEAQRLPEEILPSGELEGSGSTGEAGVGAEVSLPGLSVFSGFDHQLSLDPSQAVVSESVFEGEQVAPHAEFAIGEPSGWVRDLEQELVETAEIQQQVVVDLETAPESATESSSVPVQDIQDIQVSASLELPEQCAGEPLSTSSPFEAESSAAELHDQQLEPEFTTSPQQPEDFPPPLQRDLAAEPPSFEEGVADLSVTPSLQEELVKETEAGVITGTLQFEQDQASEPAPYHQTEESHQEFEQEPYQEQQHSEEGAVSYHAASGDASVDVQDPVSVSDVIQSVETRPVIESVSDETSESRNIWWKEGGHPEPEGEIPVVETVSDQSQQSRQSWWEQSGSEPVLQHEAEELPAEPLPPQPDLSSIPPPPPPTSEEEEQAVVTTPSIPAEIDAVSPSSDTFPEVIPEPLPSTFDQGGGAAVESPLSSSVDGSTLPTENGEVSGSSDEAFTPASVLSPEGSTPGASNLSPDGVEPAAASSKEPIPTQA